VFHSVSFGPFLNGVLINETELLQAGTARFYHSTIPTTTTTRTKSFEMLFLFLLPPVATVSAHAVFQDLWVNGKDKASTCIRMPKNNSPLTNVNSPDMRCNVGGSVGVPEMCDIQGKLTIPP
jgi:hypothetical protein